MAEPAARTSWSLLGSRGSPSDRRSSDPPGRPTGTRTHDLSGASVRNPQQQLGDLLLEQGLIDRAQLDEALEQQRLEGGNLGRILVERGVITEHALVAALAKRLGMDFADLSQQMVDPSVVTMIPEALARRHRAVPIGVSDDGDLVVAMSDPSNIVALDDLRTVTDRSLKPVVATRSDVEDTIDRYLSADSDLEQLQPDEPDDTDEELEELADAADDAPIVRFCNQLISRAVRDRASDIHVEPQERQTRVRLRVDGVLHEVQTQPRKVHNALTSRLKIMAELDIAEKRIPQDGRISGKFGGRAVDLRVSTLPTVFGEKVVMRILDKSSVLLDLADLGFRDVNFQRFKASYTKPYGMILVTGPTGSGKSTTLYATLNAINSPTVNIVTVEDPVEYRLAGISQVHVHQKAGLTFPNALRSILRQDPDVVLVGEMRDRETAAIGMEAALTGHLVLSTLHTNDAPSAVTRLIEMGIEPFLVSSSVDCVLAQRLLRRLCAYCKQPYTPSTDELESAGFAGDKVGDDKPNLYRAVGCPSCAHTGYRGRTAVHEVMTVTEEIQRLIAERATAEDIEKFARAQQMESLREDGLVKALQGTTTLEEVARVVV